MTITLIHPTAHVGTDVELGDDVHVGAYTIIEGTTRIGAGSRIGSHCLINESGIHGALDIGTDAIVRSHTVIYGGSSYGNGLQAGHHAIFREGMHVGHDVSAGTYCELRGHSTIGDHCRFLANVHICQYSTIGSFVWMFAFVLTTNDPRPPSDGLTRGPTIEDGAIITSNASLLPGVRIGRMAIVASGAVVTRDVAPGRVAQGVPARDVASVTDIVMPDGSPAYPWWDRFQRGFPKGTQFPDMTDVLERLAEERRTDA